MKERKQYKERKLKRSVIRIDTSTDTNILATQNERKDTIRPYVSYYCKCKQTNTNDKQNQYTNIFPNKQEATIHTTNTRINNVATNEKKRKPSKRKEIKKERGHLFV